MLQSVNIGKQDGNLGIASNVERILAVIAPANAGDLNVPYSFANPSDLIAQYQSGKLVETCTYMLDRGVPVISVRCNATTLGSYGVITSTGKLGTANVAAGTTKPGDDFDVIVKIVTGGALGTAGITFIYSLDNGVTWSATQALGTSLTMTLEQGVSFALTAAASTLLAGDTWSVSTVGPRATSADLTTAFQALKDFDGEWLRILVLTDADATILGACDSFAKSFWPEGKYPEIIANTRARGSAETRPVYQTALAAISSAVQSTEISCCVDQCEVVSPSSGRRLRQPQAIPYAARLMTNDDSQDASAPADGALVATYLTTPAGARNYHDERVYPGLDALGFTTLRTWRGRPRLPGIYVNNPRLLAGSSSDYQLFQHSALENRINEKIFALLVPRLSRGVLCDATTGRIRADVAKTIEDDINGILLSEFVTTKRCSGVKFMLSRTDDVLRTFQITFSNAFVPLGYPKAFTGKSGIVTALPQAS